MGPLPRGAGVGDAAAGWEEGNGNDEAGGFETNLRLEDTPSALEVMVLRILVVPSVLYSVRICCHS